MPSCADNAARSPLPGGEVSSGWHWGTNLVFEHETGGAQENGYEITAGISRTLVDQRFSIGGEVKAAWIDEKTDRGNFANEILVGPSFQFRPLVNTHIDLAPLFGVTDESPDAKLTLVFGWEF